MFSGSTIPQTPENDIGGNKRLACPLHGCSRVYSDESALDSHVKEHEIPAQSVPGKVLLCSSAGCSGSFPDMQKLMEHMRHHHKLNIFFQCESCRTKLRSYRGLLTHLHTCSKMPRAKSKLPDPTLASPGATTDPAAMDQQPSQPETASALQQTHTQAPLPDEFSAAAGPGPQPESAAPILLTPSSLPLQETTPPPLTEAAPPAALMDTACSQPPPLDLLPAMPSPLEVQPKTERMSPEPMQPGPGPAAHSPPAATWRKTQGMPSNRRILWGHTRGRYTCLQCGHVGTNRKEITQHINSLHSGNKAAEGTGNPAANA